MFERNEVLEDGLEMLWAKFGSTVKRGQTIRYSEIEDAMGYIVSTRVGWAILCKFRKKLASVLSIITVCIPGEGVKLLTHQQAAKHSTLERAKKARRCVNRGIRESSAVDATELDPLERRSFHAGVNSMKYNRLALSRCRREIETLSRASETLPKRSPQESKRG